MLVSLIFHRPGPCHFIVPPPPVGIERVTIVKLLGVYLASTLSVETRVNYVLSLANQRLYLIDKPRKQGLSAKAREVVFHSLVIGLSRRLYALPAFVGFCLVLTLLALMLFSVNLLDGIS